MKSIYRKAYHLLNYLTAACWILMMVVYKEDSLQMLRPAYRLLLGFAMVNCIFVFTLHIRLPQEERITFDKVAYRTYWHPYSTCSLTVLYFLLEFGDMESTLWKVLFILDALLFFIMVVRTSIKGFLSDE